MKKTAGLVATALAAGALIWVSFGKGAAFPIQPDYANEVIDGDTFYTVRRVKLRLGDLDAPEIGKCGGKEAKKRHEELILNKPLFISHKGTDQFGRSQVFVYTVKGFVNLKLIEEGLVYYVPDHEGVQKFKDAGEKARSLKKGIYSTKCTQIVNLKEPKCDIKGNVNFNNQKIKIYYTPDCGIYKRTLVELYKGDSWFCSEKDAIKAGFRKPKNCE